MKDFNKYCISSGIGSTTLSDYTNFMNTMTPVIVDERKDNTVMVDVFSKMMSDRIIFLGTGIFDTVANVMNAQLLYLDHQSNDPIKIYINSPGGSVYDGLAIYDTIKFINSPVHTVNTGLAASMASVILASGDVRSSLKSSRVLLHQPMGGARGQESDIKIVADEIAKLKKELYTCLSNDTGQPYKRIEQDADRDFYLNAREAKKYGIIDNILAYRKKTKRAKK